MTVLTNANVGTAPVREALRFDLASLERWMASSVVDFRGPLRVEQFNGGQSNPTYRLDTPDRRYVLRRKPPGALLKGAHAIEREVQVLRALGSVDFPVPEVFGLCMDDGVIGTAFYMMEMVEGRIFWDAALPELSATQRDGCYDAMNATIAQLHALDHEELGLGDFGKAGNFFERQIARWSRQYYEDGEAGRDANMDRLIAWLSAHIPVGDEASITHGDFRIDNLIFDPVEPRIVAVLDWELSTIGNPLSDFAYHAMMYYMPPDIVAGLGATDVAALNIPSETAYREAYCRRTGRITMPHYTFYLAFNFFRLAAIFHGIKGRVIRGTASSAQASARAQAFPRVVQIGLRLTDSAEP